MPPHLPVCDSLRGMVRAGAGREDPSVSEAVNRQWLLARRPVGMVTGILDEEHLDCHPENGVAIMCGPPMMMKSVSQTLIAKGYSAGDIYLSLERNMSCGLGKCGHCRLGPYHVCYDGPVFTYEQLQALDEAWE